MTKQHHVIHSGKGWKVIANDASRASATALTKAEAERIGRQISQNQHSELIIHNMDGRISRCDSHGNDPCPPKDKN